MTQGLFATSQDGQHFCVRAHQQLQDTRTEVTTTDSWASVSAKAFGSDWHTLAEMAEAAAVLMHEITSPFMTWTVETFERRTYQAGFCLIRPAFCNVSVCLTPSLHSQPSHCHTPGPGASQQLAQLAKLSPPPCCRNTRASCTGHPYSPCRWASTA